MKYIETIATFYKQHGTIIQNLFDFVPELGSPRNPLSVSAARIFLDLVNSRGGEWVLEEWHHDRLAPLFQVQPLISRLAEKEQSIVTLSAQLADEQQSVQTLSAQLANEQDAVQTLSDQLAAEQQSVKTFTESLAAERQSVQLLSTQLAKSQQSVQALSEQSADDQQSLQRLSAILEAKETTLNRITNSLGWRILSLYGKIKYPYLLPLYRLLNLSPREPKTSDNLKRTDNG